MSAADDYKLSRIYPGGDVRDAARASRINALQGASRSFDRGDPFSRATNSYRMIGPGWVINRARRGVIRGGGVAPFPWQMIIVTVDGTYYVKCRLGTINNMIPINMFEQFAITDTGTWYVILDVDTDGYRPVTCNLGVDTSPPPPLDVDVNVAPDNFQVLIGTIVNLVKFQAVDGLLSATPTIALQTLTENPQPGRPYWDNNYMWNLTQY